MTKKLAVLSGKGGSGKTSLSLCIANLLSTCEIKTLLIDCDFSTNGATYFFETFLDSSESYYSVKGLINAPFPDEKDNKVISIHKYFDFIPSVSKIGETPIDSIDALFFTNDIFNHISKNYDVIIFDCQAGYSDVLKEILTGIDETLFVMEADTISSASIRSLYLKIGNLLTGKRKSYQVFNKVTSEEYEIYNKISGGTFFTNIESVLFDWTIRKAFALSQIPSLEKVSVRFYEQLLNICNVLFAESYYIEKLNNFSKKIISKKIQEEKFQLRDKISSLHNINKRKKYRILTITAVIYIIVIIVFTNVFFLDKYVCLFELIDKKTVFLLSSAFIGFFGISLLLDMITDLLKKRNEEIDYKRKLSSLEEDEKNYK